MGMTTQKNLSNDSLARLIPTPSVFAGLPDEVEYEIFDADDDWRAARFTPGRIGGSDIAGILGVSPFKTALSVWLQKTGREPAKPSTMAQTWGLRLEKPILEAWRNATEGVEQYSDVACLITRDGWKVASPDALAIVDGLTTIVEAKTVSAWQSAEWDNDIPEFYLTQGLWYLHVTGFERLDYIVLIGGQEPRIFSVLTEEYPEYITLIVEAVERWRETYLLADNPPPALPPVDYSALNWAYSESDIQSEIDRKIIDGYVRAKLAEAEAKAAAESAGTRLKETLKEATVGLVGGQKAVTWKAPRTSTAADRRKKLAAIIADAETEMALIDADQWEPPAPARRLNIVAAYRSIVGEKEES